MYLEIIIFVLFLILQLVLGLNSISAKAGFKKRYLKALSSGVDLSETVESLMTIFDKFNIKVKVIKQLDAPILSKEGDIYINQNDLYKTYLLINYLAIFEFIVNYEAKFLLKIIKYQKIVFILGLIIFVVGVILNSDSGLILINLSIVIEILLTVISFLIYLFAKKLFRTIQKIAMEILKFDDVEKARGAKLNSDLQLMFFEYPLWLFQSLWHFVKP